MTLLKMVCWVSSIYASIEFDGKRVPDVLLSGHHENIRKWRLKESLKRTLEKRPDLLKIEILQKKKEN